jgi:hypothetical protein
MLNLVRLDLVFALCDRDEETGNPINVAITKNGFRCYGLTKCTNLKERVLGRGDAEIVLDGDWWETATAEQQEALLDHEMHHVAVKTDKHGNIQKDDIGRPLVKLRKHDIEVGWFSVIAARNGVHSQERIQAKIIMDNLGQYFFPDLCPPSSKRIPMGTGAKSESLKA